MNWPADRHLLDFVDRFNCQAYFEAHEVLEELWMVTQGERREFFQGLIQMAAAFLKVEQGQFNPASRLAQRAASRLQKFRPSCAGVNVNEILGWLQEIEQGKLSPSRTARLRLELSET